jgi:hypothetical protein
MIFFVIHPGRHGISRLLIISEGITYRKTVISGHSLVVKLQPSKLAMRVRFPLPALVRHRRLNNFHLPFDSSGRSPWCPGWRPADRRRRAIVLRRRDSEDRDREDRPSRARFDSPEDALVVDESCWPVAVRPHPATPSSSPAPSFAASRASKSHRPSPTDPPRRPSNCLPTEARPPRFSFCNMLKTSAVFPFVPSINRFGKKHARKAKKVLLHRSENCN